MELSLKAAQMVIKVVNDNPKAVLGLATGGTPKGTYEKLIKDHKENHTDYSNIQTVNLDEYLGIDPDDANSYRTFMKQHLFNEINIQEKNTHIPNGQVDNYENECQRYDHLIQDIGGIDIQLLGIGQNGHIGFNEPGTPFSETTHIVNLTHDTRKANARFFKDIKDVPSQAITLGIKNILESRLILLLASGENKAKAMARLLNGRDISESFPASALHLHEHVVVIADEAALSLVDKQKRSAY